MADWADLPLLVIEKIIRYAVSRKYGILKETNAVHQLHNYWALRVYHYSNVCQNWRSATFSSKCLFLTSEPRINAIVCSGYYEDTEENAIMLIED